MKRAILSLIFLLLPMSGATKQKYFPEHAFDDREYFNQIVVNWYSSQLQGLQEPSLYEISQTSKQRAYRFLYLPSFNHPIAVRLEVKSDGSGILTIKQASGVGGGKPGKLIESRARTICRDQTERFVDRVEKLNYWTLPTKEKENGNDGARWILEATRDGRYKIVDRWSPENGPIRELGLYLMIDLAGLPLTQKDVY